MVTPSYVFFEQVFRENVDRVKSKIGADIPLCYSIKANPFLLYCLPDSIARIEVCSPGELCICQALQLKGEKIIYSGVMKETCDIERAVEYGVSILTAESPLQLALENEVCLRKGVKANVILRLSSGNQFGMGKEDLFELIQNREDYPGLHIMGLHYYSGTQKKTKAVERDLKKLEEILILLKESYGFEPSLVEYGPGLSIDYFHPEKREHDMQALHEAAELINAFAEKYPIGIEMGRYLASECGEYHTTVKDLKKSKDADYVICDGGIHHLKYYGQNMAMLVPEMSWIPARKDDVIRKQEYCICGSLCTVADVLVRNVELPELSLGDELIFQKCGAYSVTEGASLFLSRDLPAVYIGKSDGSLLLIRDSRPSYVENISDYHRNNV